MKSAAIVLKAVAAELAATAKQKVPKLKKGELITKEHFSDGIYTRETSFGNRYQYDFRLKESTFTQINPSG